MSRSSHFFDVESAEQLFCLLREVANRFTLANSKRAEDLLLLVFGLTHLREWIAPGYLPTHEAVEPAEKFYQKIFELEEFKLLQALCNRSKHMHTPHNAMATLYRSPITLRPDANPVSGSSRRTTEAYFVDGRDLEDVIRAVVKFYADGWFEIQRSSDVVTPDGEL